MTIKEELHRLIDGLDETEASEVLDYLRWLSEPEEELTPEELESLLEGEAQIERGEYATLESSRWRLGQ
ncbi:MAG: hypothetical protein L0177_00285 [Chloroflexi bacterium]|nr:hypothetical protein [Chloroflexota bacterium]